MIIPNRCPKCGNILVNDISFSNAKKSCNKIVGHAFTVYFHPNTDEILSMHYKNYMKPKICIYWNFMHKYIQIFPFLSIKRRSFDSSTMTPTPNYQSKCFLPWFEPDLSDFPKLLNKIKTYILLS